MSAYPTVREAIRDYYLHRDRGAGGPARARPRYEDGSRGTTRRDDTTWLSVGQAIHGESYCHVEVGSQLELDLRSWALADHGGDYTPQVRRLEDQL